MTKDKNLKEFGLDKIAKSKIYETTDICETFKIGFSASLHFGITDLPNHIVVWLQVDRIDRKKGIALSKKCYIYYKNESL